MKKAIRVTYYENNKLALIAAGMRPAFEAVSAVPGIQAFVRSGWQRGSHVDLRVVGDVSMELLEEVASHLRAWVDQHPSKANVDEAAYLALSQRLAALEGVDGPLLPLRPDNSVEIVAYESPRLVDGHDELLPVYERFFSRTAPLIFELAKTKIDDPGAATMALIGMLGAAAAELRPEGLARGVISLKAHADFFFANYDTSHTARAHYERFEQAYREQLDRALASGGPPAWQTILRETRAEVEAAFTAHPQWASYNPSAFATEGDAQLAARQLAANQSRTATFAQAGFDTGRQIERGQTLDTIMGGATASDLAFFGSESFQIFRILLNFYYSLLPTLGISPVERFGMCYLVSRCVDRGVGV